MIDGGDQVSQVLTLFLLPIALTDSRMWHWQHSDNRSACWKRLVALSAVVALRIQVAGIYLHAAIGKLGVQEWRDGTALYYWFIHPAFGAPRPVWYLLLPLLRHGLTLTLMTWSAIILELFLFTALVMPKRAWVYFLVAGLIFHAGIALIHGLMSFSIAMAAALVLYLRPIDKSFILPSFAHAKEDSMLVSTEPYRSL
jgi:antimicrobial peptide system SdpB family protein